MTAPEIPPVVQDNQRGASLVEYALLVALIAVVALVAIALAGGEVSATFSTVTSGLESG